MATGKSIIGKEVAGKLGRRFADLDDLIESKEKRRISDIFAENGEPYFRKAEKEVLRRAAQESGFVYACGGGIVMDKENIAVMKKTGRIVCLTASPEVILKRVGDTSHRPLLNVPDPKKQVEQLLASRAPFYAQADITVDTSALSVEQVTAKILNLIGKIK